MPVPAALWLSVRVVTAADPVGLVQIYCLCTGASSIPGGWAWVWASPWDFGTSGGLRAPRGLGFEARRGFFYLLLFQAADKQSAKRISSRAGFETHRTSTGRWPSQPWGWAAAGAGRKMLSRDIKGCSRTIRKQLVVLPLEQAALIAKVSEHPPQRVSARVLLSPPSLPLDFPQPRTPSSSGELAGPGPIRRQKIVSKWLCLKGEI